MHLLASQHPYVRVTPGEPLGTYIRKYELFINARRHVCWCTTPIVKIKWMLGEDSGAGYDQLSQSQFEFLLDQALVSVFD